MANLAHKDDSNIEVILKRDGTARVIKAMRGIPNSVHVQAAGSWQACSLFFRTDVGFIFGVF